MVKLIHKLLLTWKWRKLRKRLSGAGKLEQCILLTKLFNKYTAPNLTLFECNKVYFTPEIASLNTLVNELTRVVNSYITTSSILPVLGRGSMEKVTLAYWLVFKTPNESYQELSLYEAYVTLSELIMQLHMMVKSDLNKTYVDRRCNRLFTAYIQLITMIMEIKLYGGTGYNSSK
jgi:hypothetical protein